MEKCFGQVQGPMDIDWLRYHMVIIMSWLLSHSPNRRCTVTVTSVDHPRIVTGNHLGDAMTIEDDLSVRGFERHMAWTEILKVVFVLRCPEVPVCMSSSIWLISPWKTMTEKLLWRPTLSSWGHLYYPWALLWLPSCLCSFGTGGEVQESRKPALCLRSAKP